MVKIVPDFKSSEERNVVALAIGLSLVCGGYFSFVPSLIVYFGTPDMLSENGKEIVRNYLNFMGNIAIILAILTITGIGLLLVPLVLIYGLIYVIIDLLAVLNNTEVSIPVFFELLKPSSVIVEDRPSDNNDELKP